MLVYGDHNEVADPQERLGQLRHQLATAASATSGIDRHATVVGALVGAGQLLQGVADAGAAADELNAFVHDLARAVVRSYDSRFAETGELPRLGSTKLPRAVQLRLPEGFAFYAVYPEAYIEAARKLRLSGPPCVIGIRSIGTTLGAIVAATLGAPPALTVRPFGDPFARCVELPPEIIKADAHYVIVDEGPGLSGSSFGSVADWLEERGVPLERLAFLPSHGGDLGPQASVRHRTRWSRAQRVPAEFEPSFLTEQFGRLEEYSTGHPWERRKYLATIDGTRVLLKFAGLGQIGARKLEMARALHAAGFSPEPLGLVHGFLVERWCENARPPLSGEKPVAEIGRYIAARANLFPAGAESGASLDELFAMCRRNLSLGIGEWIADRLERWDATALSLPLARVRTDNKMDSVEWLRTADGRLLKVDALDHHQAHDLIGCQDIAWDIAGAIVEFDLHQHEIAALVTATRRPVDPALLEFYRLAYCAFRLGHARIAAEVASSDAALTRSAESYAAHAEDVLHQHTQARLSGNPRLMEGRNEPAREQTSFTRVDEEEAGSVLS